MALSLLYEDITKTRLFFTKIFFYYEFKMPRQQYLLHNFGQWRYHNIQWRQSTIPFSTTKHNEMCVNRNQLAS